MKAYSIRAFCTAYSIGRTKTYELIRVGELKVVKVGRRTLVPKESARSWFRKLHLENSA